MRLERILFATGIFLLGVWAAGTLGARAFQSIEARRLEDSLRNALRAGRAADDRDDRIEAGDPGFLASLTRQRAELGESFGLLEIPRLGLSATIAEGTRALTLLRCIGHVAGTSFPGELGNVALAGHRDTFFRKLEQVELGDRVHIVTPDGAFQYRISRTEVVEPTDTQALQATDQATLTLVTCYPFQAIGPAPRRFIVRAFLVTSPGTSLAGSGDRGEGQKVGASHDESERL